MHPRSTMTVTLPALFVPSIGADFASRTAFCAHFAPVLLRPAQFMQHVCAHNHAVTDSRLAALENSVPDRSKLVYIRARSSGSGYPWTLQ